MVCIHNTIIAKLLKINFDSEIELRGKLAAKCLECTY